MEQDVACSSTAALIQRYEDELSKGLKLARHLTGSAQIFFAVPLHLAETAKKISSGNLADVVTVKPVYPYSMNEIISRSIKGAGPMDPVISVKCLIDMVRALSSGFPPVETIVTVI
jgi:hypothetical protein